MFGAAKHGGGTVQQLKLRFELADLSSTPDARINAKLLAAAPATDLFLFCYVCHESNAYQYDVLPELLARATVGAIFLFVDLWLQDLVKVREECVAAAGVGVYTVSILGSSQAFPFKAMVCRKER